MEKRSMITNAAEINQYDANGNRTRVTRPGVTQEFLFDSRDVMSLSKEGTTLLGMYDYNFDGMRVRHEGSDRGDVISFHDGVNVLEESIIPCRKICRTYKESCTTTWSRESMTQTISPGWTHIRLWLIPNFTSN